MLLLHLKTLLRQLVLPPASLLLLAAAGLLLLRRRSTLGRALIAIGLASLWLLATPIVASALTRLAQRVPALNPERLGEAQAIVILGGGGQRAWAPEYRGPSAGPELMQRLAYGAYLSRRTHLPILVSGLGIEAEAMRTTLRDNFDIVPRWVDAQAYDTFQNARNAAAVLGRDDIRRVILVTRATHMLRAMHEFAAAGLDVIAAPVGIRRFETPEPLDFIPNADGLLLSSEACYELLGERTRWLLAVSHLRRQQHAQELN